MTKPKAPRVRWTRGMPTKDGWYMFRDSTVFPDYVPTTIQTYEDGTKVAVGGGVTIMWGGHRGLLHIGRMRYVRLDAKGRKS